MTRNGWEVLAAILLLIVLVGCTHSLRLTEQQNKAVVNRFGEASNAKNFEAIRELLAADFVRHCQATPDVVVQNREQFLDYLKADAAVIPDSRQTLRHMVAEGDLVAFWIKYEGTQEGQMGPFPSIAQENSTRRQRRFPDS
jgi:predicted ester cyclase